MARGSSDQIADDLNLVAARGGDVRGTALADLGEIELGDQEWSALKALVSLATEHPVKGGYSSELIRLTAAYLLVSRAERLDPVGIDQLLEEMEQSGLVERAEPGWRPSRAGVQPLGAFITADWDQAILGD
jgi:hypothetical protein